MPESDPRHLTFKLVYFGLAQSNLLRLHDQLAPAARGGSASIKC
jgi:hypothetical protein